MQPKHLMIFTLLLVASLLITACSSLGNHPYDLAPLEEMPPQVQSAPKVVQNAYQFAVANPGVLTELPCYCGCGGMGHTSNYACYVADIQPEGAIIIDNHALGCSICVDITQDAMRMLDKGIPLGEIRTYIDQTYSALGPSNIP